jgi:hypothetical protein
MLQTIGTNILSPPGIYGYHHCPPLGLLRDAICWTSLSISLATTVDNLKVSKRCGVLW